MSKKASNDEIQAVVSAIEDSKWTWRTVEAIARITDLPDARVREILNDNPEIFFRSPFGHRDTGEPIYTTRDRYKEETNFFQRWVDISSSTST